MGGVNLLTPMDQQLSSARHHSCPVTPPGFLTPSPKQELSFLPLLCTLKNLRKSNLKSTQNLRAVGICDPPCRPGQWMLLRLDLLNPAFLMGIHIFHLFSYVTSWCAPRVIQISVWLFLELAFPSDVKLLSHECGLDTTLIDSFLWVAIEQMRTLKARSSLYYFFDVKVSSEIWHLIAEFGPAP